MASSDRGRYGSRPAGAGTTAGRPVRPVRRWLAVSAALVAAALPLAAAVPAGASGKAPAAGAALAATGPVTITVTSMSSSYAKPGQTILISGTLRNNSAAPLSNPVIQLSGSSTPLNSRALLGEFAAGTYVPWLRQLPRATWTASTLAPGASVNWKIQLAVDSLGLNCFGVYPLAAAVATNTAAGPASVPVALPFWPAKAGACLRPSPEPISWIWPLIDYPRQGACPALSDNSLLTSFAPDGRLGGLLGAAVANAAAAKVTLAIDPALLENAKAMTAQYAVGGTVQCSGGTPNPASPVAKAWLASLVKLTTGSPALLTPYADVDVAALTQHGLTSDLKLAFGHGQQVGRAVLPGSFPGVTAANAPNSTPAASLDATVALLGSLAWPADGDANYPVLENLASLNVSTVILDSRTMPTDRPTWYTPGAVTKTPDGVGRPMTVLLSDHQLTALLASAAASSPSDASIFAVRQLFLAETAMISAENPSLRRSVVIAPPRHWDPAPKLAAGLLADTASAPWLQPSTPAELVKFASDQPSRRPPSAPSGLQLSGPLMRQVAKLDSTVGLLQSLTPGNPSQALYRALFATESSAWRGRRTSAQAWDLLHQSSAYATGQLGKLTIGGARKVILGGTTGSVLISVHNELPSPVQLRILVSTDNASIKIAATQLVTVPAGSGRPPGSVKTIKLPVQAAQDGSARVRISLASPSGEALPVRSVLIQVQATQFGTLTLIICAAALAVFVLASAFRAIRSGRPTPAAGGQVADQGLMDVAEARVPGEDAGSFGAERTAMTAAAPGSIEHVQQARAYRPTEGSQ